MIATDEKRCIRGMLLKGAAHLPDSVAKQNTVATARLARLDYPNDWPDLINEIFSKIAQVQNEPKVLLRYLLMLHQIIKSLSSLRISSARANFHEVRNQFWELSNAYLYSLLRKY